MTTNLVRYVVSYSDERGNAVDHHYTAGQLTAAVTMYAALTWNGPDAPAVTGTALPFAGWYDIVQYGVTATRYDAEYGNTTVTFAALFTVDDSYDDSATVNLGGLVTMYRATDDDDAETDCDGSYANYRLRLEVAQRAAQREMDGGE